MNVFLLISLSLSLYYCGEVTAYSASNVSESLTNWIEAATNVISITKDIGKLKKKVKNIRRSKRSSESTPKPRARRSSDGFHAALDKFDGALRSILKTYIWQPLTHGNFEETPIRLQTVWSSSQGKFIFGSLDGEPNKSFKSLIEEASTGDIIACRTKTNRLAEHYMMVYGDDLAEVTVAGGKKTTSDNGLLTVRPYTASEYYDSNDCLLHENRLNRRARDIDASRGDGKEGEIDARIQEIVDRLSATVASMEAQSKQRFDYDLYSCNCQDFVLYWAYGYVEHYDCIKQLFRDKYIPNQHGRVVLFRYIDADGSADEELYGPWRRTQGYGYGVGG